MLAYTISGHLSGGILRINGIQSFYPDNYNYRARIVLGFTTAGIPTQRAYQMMSRSVTTQKAALAMPDSTGSDIEKPEDSATVDESGQGSKPAPIIAGTKNPSCEHDWLQLADDLQTLASEGKIIWQCSICAEITNTYNWQTP